MAKEWLSYGEKRVPKLYAQIRAGEMKPLDRGDGKKGKLIYLKPQGGKKQKDELDVQQPSLFDFTKKKSDVLLSTIK